MPEIKPSGHNPLMQEIKPSGDNPLRKHFRQPKIYLTLPSKGKYYPEGSLEMPENQELPVYAMTAKDELALKTPDALLNGQATVDMIKSCIPNIKDPWKMPALDIDACLVAIRIATYGETMEITATPPGLKETVDYSIDLRHVLDRYTNAVFNPTFTFENMEVTTKPLTYMDFSKINMQTFEEQRILALVNTDDMQEDIKLQKFTESFNKIRDLTLQMVANSVEKITLLSAEDTIEVTERAFITEFLENSEKKFFSALQEHIKTEKEKFQVPPMDVRATEEQIEQGVPETFQIPITFDQSTFFA
jgi:hypothetical protein